MAFRLNLSLDRAALIRAARNIDNQRPFWSAVQSRQVQRSRQIFHRLRNGGTYRGVTWSTPTKSSPPSGTPFVNQDSGRMLRSIRPDYVRRRGSSWQTSISCKVPYAAERNKIAPFLFWSSTEAAELAHEYADFLLGGNLPSVR